MLDRAHGIILRVRPLTDSSWVVHWLTREYGRVATVAKGARRQKSAFSGKLDVFVQADLSFQRSQRGDLHILREVLVTRRYGVLSRDMAALQIAAYATALIEQVTETETPLTDLFELMEGLLGYLEVYPAVSRAVYAFELKLLAGQGMEPDTTETLLQQSTCALLQQLVELRWADLATLQPPPEAVREMRSFLERFLAHHFGRLARGRNDAIHGISGNARIGTTDGTDYHG